MARRILFVLGCAALAGCAPDVPLSEVYAHCVTATVKRAMAADPRPVPAELKGAYETMQRRVAEAACGQQRDACERQPGSDGCRAFVERYAR